MNKHQHTTTLIVAAGAGSRAGGAVPKQYMPLQGVPMLAHSIRRFCAHAGVGEVRVVINPAHRAAYDAVVASLHGTVGIEKLGAPITGGAERQDSVRMGLEALKTNAPDKILIHDAARPFVSSALISAVLAALDTHMAAVPTMQLADTVREKTSDGTWRELNRSSLRAMQTPQGFHFGAIMAAHEAMQGQKLTDDIAVMMAYDAHATIAETTGEAANRKITTPEDVKHMQTAATTTRVAMGYDVHKFAHATGSAMLRIGGVDVAHTAQLEGHSDADVVLHAITDAVLGTHADGDIGQHFAPSDAQWKNADSAIFLKHAIKRAQEAGGTVQFIDVTVIGEAPKIAPVREAMRTRIAEIMGLKLAQVSVKATTTEGLGFEGRREGIAAHAVVTATYAAGEGA